MKNFEMILKELRQYQLSEFISGHLSEIVRSSSSTSSPNQITFSYLTAFLQLLSNLESMRKIYLSIGEKKARTIKSPSISKEEFLTEAQHYPRTTPLQIDILFAIIQLLHKSHAGHEHSPELLQLEDFDSISANEHLLPYRLRSEIVEENYKVEHQSVLMKILESGYRFALGKNRSLRKKIGRKSFRKCRRGGGRDSGLPDRSGENSHAESAQHEYCRRTFVSEFDRLLQESCALRRRVRFISR